MKEKYCMECGSPHPPHAKFCGGCRNPFDPATVASRPAAPKIAAPAAVTDTQDNEDDDDDGESVTSVPEVKGLEVNIVPPRSVRGETLGTFAGTVKKAEDFGRPKEKKMTRKEFLANWQKEAGAIKPKNK